MHTTFTKSKSASTHRFRTGCILQTTYIWCYSLQYLKFTVLSSTKPCIDLLSQIIVSLAKLKFPSTFPGFYCETTNFPIWIRLAFCNIWNLETWFGNSPWQKTSPCTIVSVHGTMTVTSILILSTTSSTRRNGALTSRWCLWCFSASSHCWFSSTHSTTSVTELKHLLHKHPSW